MYFPTTPEEVEALGTVLATGWKAGRFVAEQYRAAKAAKEHTALTVAVMRSEPTATDGYRLDFRFHNRTPHAVYLERLYLLDPKAKDLDIRLLSFTTHDTDVVDRPPPGEGMGMGEKKAAPVPARLRGVLELPVRIEPAGAVPLTLFVQPDAKLWFDRASVGIGKAKVSCLGEDTQHYIAWRFGIRHKKEKEQD